MAGESKNNSEQKLEKLKNQKVIAIAIVVGTITIALASFTDAIGKLYDSVSKFQNVLSSKPAAATAAPAVALVQPPPNPVTAPLPAQPNSYRKDMEQPVLPVPECKYIFFDNLTNAYALSSEFRDMLKNVSRSYNDKSFVAITLFNPAWKAETNDVAFGGPGFLLGIKEFKEVIYGQDISALVFLKIARGRSDTVETLGGWAGPIRFKEKALYYEVDREDHPPTEFSNRLDPSASEMKPPVIKPISYQDAVRRAAELKIKTLPKCEDVDLGVHKIEVENLNQ